MSTESADLEHLRLLSIFHYIVAGLAALCGSIPCIHVTLGIAFAAGAFDQPNQPPPPAFLGWIFIVFGSTIIVLAWTFAVCMVFAGRRLVLHKNYWFCFVMACIECCFSPFGTVLGVFTLVVLLRPSVKAMFGVGPPD